jgi:hypothetical protein
MTRVETAVSRSGHPIRTVLLLGVALGVGWHVIVVLLMRGRWNDALRPSWIIGAVLAGLVCARFTVWSRERRGGRESFWSVLATFYLGMVVYWAGFVVLERAIMCLRQRGWTGFELHDHLVMIYWFALYGTIQFGLLLVPLTFASRWAVWRVYSSSIDGGAPDDRRSPLVRKEGGPE